MYRLITQPIAEKVRRHFIGLLAEQGYPSYAHAGSRITRYRDYVWDNYGMAPLSLYMVWSQSGDIWVRPVEHTFEYALRG